MAAQRAFTKKSALEWLEAAGDGWCMKETGWSDSSGNLKPASSFPADTEVEWMWADAGTPLTRNLAEANPLRWTTTTLKDMATSIKESTSLTGSSPVRTGQFPLYMPI